MLRRGAGEGHRSSSPTLTGDAVAAWVSTSKARRRKRAAAGMRYLDLGDQEGIEELDIVEDEQDKA